MTGLLCTVEAANLGNSMASPSLKIILLVVTCVHTAKILAPFLLMMAANLSPTEIVTAPYARDMTDVRKFGTE